MQERYRPIGNHVLVRRSKAETVTPGGLHIPDRAQGKSMRGEVLAVGPGKLNEEDGTRIAMSVKPGDVVIFSNYGGTPLQYSQPSLTEDLVMLAEEHILAVIEPE